MHLLLPKELTRLHYPTEIFPEYKRLLMPYSKGIQISGAFGVIITQVYKGNDYEIWQHHCTIESGIWLQAYSDKTKLMINYMLKGSPAITLPVQGDVVLTEHTAQLLFVPASPSPVWFPKGRYHCIQMVPSPSYIKRLTATYPGLNKLLHCIIQKRRQFFVYSSGKISSKTRALLDQILYCNMNESQTDLNIQSRVLDLLIDYVRRYAAAQEEQYCQAGRENFEDIMRYIRNNIHTPLSIEQLARKTGKSQSEFYRLFKLYFGVSPHHCIKDLRILRAVHLIRNTGHAISLIAEMVGFDDVSGFNKAFKQHQGKAPGYLRQN